jgi:purine-cytosine permease-like protein
VSALVLSGMNDVLNSEGYTEAAWRNRVPLAAWILLISIAAFCNFLLGYRAHGKTSMLLLVLPIALAIAFFLIADIDSPRSGVIRVYPQNLESLADSLRPH